MTDKTTTVAQIMSTPVITVGPNDTMSDVQDIFRKNNIHHIPVVDDGKSSASLTTIAYCTASPCLKLRKANSTTMLSCAPSWPEKP